MDLNELFKNASGIDEENKPKSSIAITSMIMDGSSDDDVEETFSYGSAAPVVNIENHSGYIQIDLKFGYHLDESLRIIWSALEQFGENLSNNKEDEFNIPVLSITIVPLALDGKQSISAFNPIMWTLQPESPLYEKSNVIRILFEEDSVYQVENEDISLQQVVSEIKTEESTAAYLEAVAEQKAKEDEEYWEQRNQYKTEFDKKLNRLPNEKSEEKSRRTY